VQELLCPKWTQPLGPLASIDGSASQVHILTETPGPNCVFGPPAVTESSAVEDNSNLVSNDSEATIPVASCTEEQTGVYSNLGLGSSIITTDINETSAPYPVMDSVAGDSICDQGGNGDTNVTTPVAGTEQEVWTGQRASSSYENAAVNVCDETSCVENQNRQSCCYEQRKLPSLEDRQSCCHEQRKLPDMENLNDCSTARRGSISSKDGMLLLGPTVSVEKLSDCCPTLDGSILSGDGMSSLGPAVSISVENADRIVCELPVKSTAETGHEVNQSCGKGGALVPLALNDTESSIVQHDKTDCEQFEGAVEQGLSVPRDSNESMENVTGVNREEILYTDPTSTELPQSGIQPDDTPRRPARTTA